MPEEKKDLVNDSSWFNTEPVVEVAYISRSKARRRWTALIVAVTFVGLGLLIPSLIPERPSRPLPAIVIPTLPTAVVAAPSANVEAPTANVEAPTANVEAPTATSAAIAPLSADEPEPVVNAKPAPPARRRAAKPSVARRSVTAHETSARF